MKNKISKKNLIELLMILAFCLIAFFIEINRISNFDNIIYNIVTYNSNDFLKYFFIAMSQMTGAVVLILITIYIVASLKNKTLSYFTIINLLFIIVINFILKSLFVRERPVDLMLISEKGYSFPSGHSMVSLAFYGFIIYLINKEHIKISHKHIASVLLGILILLIGTSRIYLGVHYASDVIAGFIISGVYLMIYITYVEKFLKGEINLKRRQNYKRQSTKKFFESFKYATKGMIEAFKSERNMKIHVISMLIVILLGFILEISNVEWLICIILFGLVISMEIVNTAIETLVDLVSPQKQQMAGRIKDLAAGAVLVNAIIASVSGIIIFLPKIIQMI